MARFGREPGDRGTLETRKTSGGRLQGFFVPRDPPAEGSSAADRLVAGVKLIQADPATRRVRIYPTDTRAWDRNFLGPKYSKITVITFTLDFEEDAEVVQILEDLPAGLTKDFEYGLGLAQECDPLVNLIEEVTDCDTVVLTAGGTAKVDGRAFQMSFGELKALRDELARIKSRGDTAIRRVKETYVHNEMADVLNLGHKAYSLGRHPTSQWMTRVSAGDNPLTDGEQEALLEAVSASATEIASTNPIRLSRLQRDIELVNLDQLIWSYGDALGAALGESWWQRFFEENVFALQLIFGGPTVFVDAQVPIGQGDNSVKGKKIADYLVKSSLTNNAALVEIKKPSTKLMKRRPYREGVYGVQSEISEAVTQVLDQALQLTRHEADTRSRTGDGSWVSNAPRCFVVAGRASELDTPDRAKSFDLYREHLAGVRIVTYDEILEQLQTLRDFLAAD